MGRDTLQELEQAAMSEGRFAPRGGADRRADQCLGDAILAGEGPCQVTTLVDGVQDRPIVVTPGMALAAREVRTPMGTEQERRDQQREPVQGLQASLAQRRIEGGQAVVVTQ